MWRAFAGAPTALGLLDFTLVLLRGFQGIDRPQVPATPCFRVLLRRVAAAFHESRSRITQNLLWLLVRSAFSNSRAINSIPR